MYQTLLLSSYLFILQVMGTPQFLAPHGRRVCGPDLRYSIVMATESYVQPLHKPYITLCQGHRLCSTYKTAYSVRYRQVSKAAPSSHFYPECCPGWRRLHSHHCNQAVCVKPCVNGGTCVRPNLCACPLGWKGYQCQTDVDECSEQQPCTQECVNTLGSYRCACGEGYRPAGDGRSCQSIPSTPPPATPPSTSQTTVGGHADAGGRIGLLENVTEEVQSLKTRVELLEKVPEKSASEFSPVAPKVPDVHSFPPSRSYSWCWNHSPASSRCRWTMASRRRPPYCPTPSSSWIASTPSASRSAFWRSVWAHVPVQRISL